MAEFYKMNPAKWDNGTAGLSLEQEAAYLRIVNAINKADEPCPANPRVLAGFFRCRPDKAMRLLQALVDAGKVWVEGGKIYNEHAMNDVELRRELSVNRACIGRAGGIQSGLSRGKSLKDKKPGEAIASPREEKRRDTEAKASGANAPERPLVEIVFGEGLRFLTSNGVPERQARSMLGKWRNEHGDETLLTALGKAQREGAIDPVGFVTGCLKQAKRQKGKADDKLDRIKRLADRLDGRTEGDGPLDHREGDGPSQPFFPARPAVGGD